MLGSSWPLMKSYILLINTAKPTDGIKDIFVEFSEIFDCALDVDRKTGKKKITVFYRYLQAKD